MVATDFFDSLDKFGAARYVGLEDCADKFSFLYSVIILLISTLVVTVKSYVINPISCYIDNTPSGHNFEGYAENYCWVHGTIPLHFKSLPETQKNWNKERENNVLTYYQWVPFVLGMQTIMFYLPRFIWQMFCFNRGGTDLDQVLQQAVDISKKPFGERQDDYKSISDVIINTLYLHRDYRDGKVAHFRRKCYSKLSLFMGSKRLGSQLISWYLVIKILYLINAICQLIIIQFFLGYQRSLPNFSTYLFSYLKSGKDVGLSNYFPRVVFCNIPQIRHAGGRNDYTAQCVLPVNMLNEKIYIFLWFWILIVAVATIASIPFWIWRLYSRPNKEGYIRKFLKMHNEYNDNNREIIHQFVNNFLRNDGLFIVRMISNNAGDVVASHITKEIWTDYLEKYLHKNLKNDVHKNNESMAINLNQMKFPMPPGDSEILLTSNIDYL